MSSEFALYFQKRQPVIYKVFSNAIANQKLSHAYMVVGEAGTPIKETAIYLAQSILCLHPNPLADETCPICHRLITGEYPDFRFLDGSKGSIKKDNIQDTVSDFQQTPLEARGVMVYVVHHVEAMSEEAANSLLKFLEEPPDHTYAILTTRNEAKVLPTILSRCQVFHMLKTPAEEVIKESRENGIEEDDAYILSNFFNSLPSIKEAADSDEYKDAKIAFLTLLEALQDNESKAKFVTEKDVVGLLNGKVGARYFYDMMALLFEDIIAISTNSPLHLPCYDKIIKDLAGTLPHPRKTLLDVMELRNLVETNINPGLMATHLLRCIYEDK